MDTSPYDAKIKTNKTVNLNLPDSLVYSTASIMARYLSEVGSESFNENTMAVINYWGKLAYLVNEA